MCPICHIYATKEAELDFPNQSAPAAQTLNKHKQQKSVVRGTSAQTGSYFSGKHEGVEHPQSYRPGLWSRGFIPFRASREGENQTLVKATGQGCSSSSTRNPAKVLLLSEAFIHFKGWKRLTVSVGEAGEGAGELSLAALNLQLLFISSPGLLPSFVLCNFSPPLSSSLLHLSSSPLSPFFSTSSSSSSPLTFYLLVFYQLCVFFPSPLLFHIPFLSFFLSSLSLVRSGLYRARPSSTVA